MDPVLRVHLSSAYFRGKNPASILQHPAITEKQSTKIKFLVSLNDWIDSDPLATCRFQKDIKALKKQGLELSWGFRELKDRSVPSKPPKTGKSKYAPKD